MKKIKLTGGVLLFGMVWTLYTNTYAQGAEEKMTIKRTPVVKKSVEEEIQYLHKQLPDLIKKLRLDGKNEIIIGMGARYVPGSKKSYVYIEKAAIKLTGDSVSEVSFTYDQANDTGAYHEIREFINKNPSDQNGNDLQVIYKNSKGEKEEFVLKTIENDTEKVKVLRSYLENLNEFVRWLNFYAKKEVIDQKKTLQKVLRVGAV